MKKEIIVAADDLESRVAILEDGALAELHVERDPRLVGSIFKAKVVSVLPGMDAAFADIGLEKNVFLCADDVGYVTDTGVTSSNVPRSATISQRLKAHQEVVVQIIRAPVGGKGARATTRLALPGRYLVLLLSDDRQIGVSRKIEERKERDRLRKVGEEIRPKGCSLIIRTEAEGKGKQELSADLKVLVDLRDRLMQKAASARAPALLHQDLTLTYQVIRDAFTDEVSSLIIDAKGVYDNAVELIDTIAPDLRKRVKRYRGKLPIFYKHGIEGEIDRLLRRKVWLHAGGYISIDQAEAFTAIDVNTGRFTGTTGLADTILRTNLEAVEEIGRQLRLRDLGGIIVIDFIDMERPRHRQKVMKAFADALKRDRQKTNIVHLSPLGLIEMTRKRRGESLMGILTETCPVCAGLGRVRTPLTVALKIEREVRRIAAEDKPGALLVRAAPRVAEVMLGETGARSALLDKLAGCPVYVRADARLGGEEYEIVPTTIAQVSHEVVLPAKGDEVTLAALDHEESPNGGAKGGWYDGYRVLVEGLPAHLEPPFPVLLTEAAHSFGIGHVRGYEPPPPTAETARRRGRRRGGRKAAEAETSLETGAPAAAEEIVAAGIATGSEPAGEGAEEPSPGRKRASRRRPRGRRKPAAPAAAQGPSAPSAVTPEPPPEPRPEVAEGEAAGPRQRPSRRRSRSKHKPEQPTAADRPATALEGPPAAEAQQAESHEQESEETMSGTEARGPEPREGASEKRRRRRGGRGRGRPEGPRGQQPTVREQPSARRDRPVVPGVFPRPGRGTPRPGQMPARGPREMSEADRQREEARRRAQLDREEPLEALKGTPPASPEGPRRERRPDHRRGRRSGRQEESRGERPAEPKSGARPEPKPEPRPEPPAAPPAPPQTPAEEGQRRTGLLRRGARMLGRRK